MKQFFVTMAIIFGVYLLSFLMINIRLIITGNKFRGTCSSGNALLEEKLGPCACGKKEGSCES